MESSNVVVRRMAVLAVRFTLSDAPTNAEKLLAPLMHEYLALLGDSDIEIRKAALNTFNSAVHHAPKFVQENINQILPLLLKETEVRPELITVVDMGPFKHTIDKGLDSRKVLNKILSY